MRIVHLCTSDTGGAGIAASRIHSALLKSGHDSSFVSMHRFRNDIKQSYSYYDLDFQRLSLFGKLARKSKTLSRKFNFSEASYSRLQNKFLSGRPTGYEMFSLPFSELDVASLEIIQKADIINLHWVAEGFVGYKNFFPFIGKKKLVWTLHDMNPFTGGCHHADESTGYMGDCSFCPQLNRSISDKFASDILAVKRDALSSVTDKQMTIVGPSKWIMDKSVKSALFRRFRHEHFVNPVGDAFQSNDKIESRKKLKLPLEKKIFLFTAKDIDNPRKGTEYFSKALKNVEKENMIVCTVGNPAIDTPFPAISLGYVTDEQQIATIYSAADAFVLPSLAENLPNTVSEALACGTPVIAFNTGGIPEMIDPENGILVPYRDADKLASAIRIIINSSNDFDRKSISWSAIHKYSSDIAALKYASLYNEMMKNN